MDPSKIFKDERYQQLALAIIEDANKQLSASKNFIPTAGRKLFFEINIHDPLVKKAQAIWKEDYLFLNGLNPVKPCFKKNFLPDVLEGLKSAGYVFKYKN